MTFKYNADGIRTEKTVNGTTTSYHLLGDKVTFEETDSDFITYEYDYSQNVTWTYHGLDIGINNGSTYTYSFDAYITPDANISDTGVTFIANGEQGYQCSFRYDNTKKGTWQHFEITLQATSNVGRILLYPSTANIPATNGKIIYKNVQFKEVGSSNNLFTQPTNNSEFGVRGNGIFNCISNDNSIYYRYDSNNTLVSMNLDGSEYSYIRNAQGDIIGFHDNTGTQVVSYTYDTWGKIISIDTTLASTVGEKNPYRYRGYRYDSETGLYYLQSRYYNAEWGRFINADALGGKMGILLSHNVFTYCMNNPVNMADPEGNIAWWIVGGAIGAVVGGITGAIVSYKTTGKVDWKYVAGGVAAGALIGVGLGYVAEAAYTAIVATVATSGTALTSTAEKMDNVRKLGQQGESAAKIVKNTQRIESITQTAKYRIPDALDKTNKILTEVKNVKYQSLTNQLKDFSLWSESVGYDFALKTRASTQISGPLQEYIDSGKIIHLFIGK